MHYAFRKSGIVVPVCQKSRKLVRAFWRCGVDRQTLWSVVSFLVHPVHQWHCHRNEAVILTASSWLVMSRRRWRHRAAASLLRSRRRSRLRISSAVMSSVRILLFGPGKRLVVFPCPPAGCCWYSCQSWLLSSSEKSLPSNALSVDSIVAMVVGVKRRCDGSIGITPPIRRCTQRKQTLTDHRRLALTQYSIGITLLGLLHLQHIT